MTVPEQSMTRSISLMIILPLPLGALVCQGENRGERDLLFVSFLFLSLSLVLPSGIVPSDCLSSYRVEYS